MYYLAGEYMDCNTYKGTFISWDSRLDLCTHPCIGMQCSPQDFVGSPVLQASYAESTSPPHQGGDMGAVGYGSCQREGVRELAKGGGMGAGKGRGYGS